MEADPTAPTAAAMAIAVIELENLSRMTAPFAL
jgi:hypothetical protein